MINVELTNEDDQQFEFKVVVVAESRTEHVVSLSKTDYHRLTDNQVSPDQLIKASFNFLLDRETNTSILSEFDLTIISKYFPEFENEISKYYGSL